MSNFKKAEQRLMSLFIENIKEEISVISSGNNDKYKLTYVTCLNDEEKINFTKQEIKRIQESFNKCNNKIAEYIFALIQKDHSNFTLDEKQNAIINNFIQIEYYQVIDKLPKWAAEGIFEEETFKNYLEVHRISTKLLTEFILQFANAINYLNLVEILNSNTESISISKSSNSQVYVSQQTSREIIQEHINSINNAFFRIESYMKGVIKEYKYFGFDNAFTLLFKEARKYENFTQENCKLIGHYWKIAERIRVDFDQSDFDNQDANADPHFCEDCEELTNLAYERIEEFTDFVADEIEEYERKISITDIVKLQPVKQPQPVIKPIFNPISIDEIYNVLKGFFSINHQQQLIKILQSGGKASEKLIFLDNGNRLADAFKQLIKTDIITGCTQLELEAWILKNFQYRYRGQIKDFKARYLNDIISTNKDKCQKPLLNVYRNSSTDKYTITNT